MPKQVVFEDGYTYPLSDNPTPEDYAFVQTKQEELKSRKADIQKQLHPGALKTIENFGKKGILPTIGSLAGILVPIPGVDIAASMTGGLIGTYLNQQLGITEKDNTDLIVGALTPGITGKSAGIAKSAIKEFYKRMPGVPTALNQIVADQARALPGKYMPTVPASVLFQKAESFGIKLPVDKLDTIISKTLANETKLSTPNTDLINDLTRLKQKIMSNPDGLSPTDFHAEMSRFYENNKFHMQSGKPGFKGYGDVYNGFREIMDEAAQQSGTGPSATALKGAIHTFKSTKATERIEEYITKATIPRAGEEFDFFNPATVIKNLGNDKNFNTSFTPEIRQEIFGTLRKMNEVPKESSFKSLVGQGVVSGGAGMAYLMGNPKIALMLGGIEAGVVTNRKAISYMMGSEGGRRLVSKLLDKGKGRLGEKSMAVIGTYIASQFQNPIPEGPSLSQERGGLLPGQVPANQMDTGLTASP